LQVRSLQEKLDEKEQTVNDLMQKLNEKKDDKPLQQNIVVSSPQQQ
jgi:tetrahydromethanopterin S-methyltransferase subunit B